MKVNKKIIERLLKDNAFSLRASMVLGITQISVINLAKRNSEKLTLYALVRFYKKEGYTEDEIFEKKASNE